MACKNNSHHVNVLTKSVQQKKTKKTLHVMCKQDNKPLSLVITYTYDISTDTSTNYGNK